jgi:hypothetical protein
MRLVPTLASLLVLAAPARAEVASPEPQDFTAWYEPVDYSVTPQVPPLALPVSTDELMAAGPVLSQLGLSEQARDALSRNGVAIVPFGQFDDLSAFYEMIGRRGWPVFVTSDTLLHLYHIQFDETLREIEEQVFIEDLRLLLEATHVALSTQTRPGDRLASDFLDVGAHLLAGDFSAPGVVGEELQLIQAHSGFAPSPLFGYQEDYSQYVPRGHYTRSPQLENYFRAMMWLSRMTFLLHGGGSVGIDEQTARAQTAAALVLADLLHGMTYPDGRRSEEIWNRIYTVTSFFVGASDDLTPREYNEVLDRHLESVETREVLSDKALNDEAWFNAVREDLSHLRPPEIYSGTAGLASPASDEQVHQEALVATQGMRFMGQRAVPDSVILGSLVFPTVGQMPGPWGGPLPFTAAATPQGVLRVFPRGLDVMNVLGSERAAEILRDVTHDDRYDRYPETVARLRGQFAELSSAEWNRNLYWSWLCSLRALFGPWGEGYPTFMQTEAWTDKELDTALASWSALRHDTILYAKQSYTLGATAAMPMPEQRHLVGYVEPVPEFYARLLAMARMTNRGLSELSVLPPQSEARLDHLEQLIARLLDISVRELRNVALSDDDYDFIRNFSDSLEGAVTGVESEGLQTTYIADVHTDSNTGQVLEEGSGYLRALVVAYLNPEGQLVVGVGPVLTYHEFKQPMGERLTDEAWRQMLGSSQAPPPVEWSRN